MEKDFAWLCSLLISSSVRVPIPETVFLWKEELVLWVVSAPNGELRRVTHSEEGLSTPGEVLRHFVGLRETESAPGSPICIANVKGVRLAVTDDRLEDAKCLRGVFSRCSYFQRFPDEKPAPVLYTLSVHLQGSRYTSEFRTQKNGTRNCRDQRLFYKLLVYVKMVLRTVETVRRRRVGQIGLEFYVGDEGTVWMTGCTHLRLAANKAAASELTEGKKSDETPKADSEANTRVLTWLSVDKKTRPPASKFPTLRIATPPQFESDATETQLVVSPSHEFEPQTLQPADSQHQVKSSNQPSPSPTVHSRSTRPGTQWKPSFYNPHFKEILARTYAKSKNWFTSDIETVFLDMDLNLLQDEEPLLPGLKRTETLLKRSGSGPLFLSSNPELPFSHRRTEDSRKEIQTEMTLESKPTLRQMEEAPLTKPRRLKPKGKPNNPVSSLDKILALYHAQPTKQGQHRKMHSLPALPSPKTLCFSLRRG